MNSDIYISASRRDYEAVSKIKNILHSAGYTYNHDRQNLQCATDFEQTIRVEIDTSKIFLCILSENSSSSVYVREELRLALKEEKIVIPIVIDNSEQSNIESFGHLLLDVSAIRLNLNDSKSAKAILLHEIEKRSAVEKETENPCKNIIRNMQYDVFISCKSEDYPHARKVYQYLKEHNYSIFLADTELRKKGNTEYGEIIDEALDSALHMIIVATKPEYIYSTYVKSEWRTFVEEKRSGRKNGNIITIIDFAISELPISLRHFQSFRLNVYTDIHAYLPMAKRDEQISEYYFLKENAKNPNVIVLPDNLQYSIISERNGRKPNKNSIVECHYEGFLIDGTLFDSSYRRGETTICPLNNVIKGWQEGIQLMSEGSKYRFFIPSYLAYGEKGAGNFIPPYSTLIFDIELIKILK